MGILASHVGFGFTAEGFGIRVRTVHYLWDERGPKPQLNFGIANTSADNDAHLKGLGKDFGYYTLTT